MPSVQGRLAKIAALDSFKEGLRQLIVAGFTYSETGSLLATLWGEIEAELNFRDLDKTCIYCGK
jgi:hypothetical protein